MNRNRNAYRGRNIELLFRNSIGDHPQAINTIKTTFGIQGKYRTGISSGIHAEKKDVTLEFTCGRNVDANIKSYGAMGYNQLTRTSISNFCKEFNLSSEWLIPLFINKARNVRAKLFPRDEQQMAIGLFNSKTKEIVKWSLSTKASREILVLFDNNQNIFRIYKMKDVLTHIGYDLTFTDKGNIAIGKCVIFQRKGGNGKHSEHIRKDDIKHPGNNVQLKLKIDNFIFKMQDHELTRYTV